MTRMTEIWAHRGASAHAPANSLPAYELAVSHGVDGIELDVHLTADGRLVCFHDDEVRRPDGGVLSLRDATAEDLRSVDVGGDASDVTRIPYLEEVYDLLAPTPARLNVEIKGGSLRYPGIVAALSAAHDRSGMSERIVYSSFDHHTLLQMRGSCPGAVVAPLYAGGIVDPWIYLEHLGATEVHPHYVSLAVPGVLDGLHRAGITVRAWTVNSPEHWRWLIEAGVGAIMTDETERAVAFRSAIAS